MKFPFFDADNQNQRYEVLFSVKVKNITPNENVLHIVMPFPLKNSYQKLLGKHNISPKVKIRTESKFQNKYIYWKENLKPKEEKIFELNFKISTQPRNKPITSNENLTHFLKSDRFIEKKKVLKISKDLTKKTNNTYEKVKVLNDYVINNVEYGNPIKGLYTTQQALKNDKVDCGGFDTLLTSLCIAQKIPARIVCGFFASLNNEMHAWVEIFIPGKGWIAADPSIEKLSKEGRSKRQAKLGNIPADRIALSIGQDFNFKIGGEYLNLDILQNPQVFAKRGKNSIKFDNQFRAKKI